MHKYRTQQAAACMHISGVLPKVDKTNTTNISCSRHDMRVHMLTKRTVSTRTRGGPYRLLIANNAVGGGT